MTHDGPKESWFFNNQKLAEIIFTMRSLKSESCIQPKKTEMIINFNMLNVKF